MVLRQDGDRHCRGWHYNLIGSRVVGGYLHLSARVFARRCEPVNRKTQAWQNLIVNDVIQKNSIRVKAFFVQNDAVGECLLFANGYCPLRW